MVAVDERTATAVESGARRSRFAWKGETVDLPLGGAFNVANAVMAAEIAVLLGHDPAAVARALGRTPPVPGRFEAVDEGQPFTVLDPGHPYGRPASHHSLPQWKPDSTTPHLFV